jgi:hypothetical protein
MKWVVKGVDRNTGKDSTITVEADDEEKASARASYHNLLVEKLEPQPPEPVTLLGYASPKKEGPSLQFETVEKMAEELPAGPKGIGIVEGIISAGFGTIGVLCMLGSFAMTAPISEQFQSDNAIGESANRLLAINQCGVFAIGLLMCILSALICINAHMRDAARGIYERRP